MTKRVGALLWIASAFCYLVAEGVAAAAMHPGYSYVLDLISDLGRPDVSPRAALVNGAFVLQAVAFPLGMALITHRRPSALLVPAIANGVGNVLVAVVHSGTGAVAHAVGAVLAIVGGNVAIVGCALRRTSGVGRIAGVLVGALGLLSFAMFACGVPPAGAWERGGVYAIYGWQACAGASILCRRR